MIIFGLCSLASASTCVVIDLAAGRVQTVLHDVEQLAGEIDLGAVGQMAAMRETHAQDGVAGIEQREVHGGIGLRAGMRLHVGIVGAE